jgi:hypothetical protein
MDTRLPLVLGVIGSLLGVAADTASLYAVGRAESLKAAQPLISLEYLTPYLLEKPEWQLLLGHILILVAVPLMMAGLVPLYRILGETSRGSSVVFAAAGVVGLVSGAVLHGGLSFVVTLLQVTGGQPGEILLVKYTGYVQIPAIMALICMIISFGLLLVYTLAGRVRLPRYHVLANPLLIFPLVCPVGYLLPLLPGAWLITVSPNLTMLLFYGCTLFLPEIRELRFNW